MFRYKLRTLLILTAIGPPILAWAYWTAIWLGANPIVFSVLALIASLATWIIGPVAWYRELMHMVCGPEAFRPMPRKTRRHVRFRIERYADEST
jgi:hypothetical protein